MLWFLRDYPLAALLLRAATLSFESVLIGGIFFCAVIAQPSLADIENEKFRNQSKKLLQFAAAGLAISQILFISLDSALLVNTSELHLFELCTANYFVAGLLSAVTAIVFLLVNYFRRLPHPAWLVFILPLLFSSVWTSHAASRLEDRVALMLLTATHQLTAAIWIGGMPYLWLLLGNQYQDDRQSDSVTSAAIHTARRFSTTAMLCVVFLIFAGLMLSWFTVHEWNALYGTEYGIIVIAKSVLLVGLLLLGTANLSLTRNRKLYLSPSLLRIARFSEIEIGIGFTVILAAASLGSQPPAVDVTQNRLTMPEIVARMTPHRPRFQTLAINTLPAVQPIGQAITQYAISPESAIAASDRFEREWSEYNHHWAGLIVFAAGLLALFNSWSRARWTRHWPLMFLGLAIFLFFRADPEAWPLGPRGFWASFYNPEDLEHRLYILLIVGFVAFEWSVQTGRLASRKAALVFPAVCGLGGALLLTHTHSLGNVKEELLAGMSHTAIATCAIFSGSSRWLELRLATGEQRTRSVLAWAWPLFLMAIGLLLLNYREA